jgi:hypothetical protein
MIFFDDEMLANYMRNDYVKHLMEMNYIDNDETFTSHRWLQESNVKRMIYSYMYGGVLYKTAQPFEIIDIGGGFTSLTRQINNNHKYKLIDFMAHDNNTFDLPYLIQADWFNVPPTDCDIVIANDIFPNVDQRLELFIDKFFQYCSEMRILLTYYNEPRFYTVKRLDADEIFSFLAWDGYQVKNVLEKYEHYIVEPELDQLLQPQKSLFQNGRQVCMVTLENV